MLSADENQPSGTSAQRNRNTERPRGKKEPRRRKSGQQQTSAPEQLAPEQLQSVDEPVAVPLPPLASERPDNAHTHAPSAIPVESAETVPASIQAIANAYRDYTKSSLEQTRLFLEKLGCARSLESVFELQADFVKQAWDAFIADSQRIRELQRNIGRQTLAGLEAFVARMNQAVALPGASRR
jgi:hypothetical protein